MLAIRRSGVSTHVVLDLTGVTINDVPGPVASPAAARQSTTQVRRTRAARRPVRVLGSGRR